MQEQIENQLWARHDDSVPYCDVVAENDGGRTRTRCRGSWPATDEVETIENPPHAQRCGACVRIRERERFDIGGES